MRRRQFLLRAALGVGATVIACGGATTLAAVTPPVEIIEMVGKNGDDPMNEKILVAYATRCGSTIKVAETIAAQLTQAGKQVDLRPVKNVKDVDGYSAVVVGSAIRMGNWVSEALKFLEDHQRAFATKPVVVFSVHMNNLGDDTASQSARQGYHTALRKLVNPAAEGWFAGVIDLSKMSLIDRLITQAMKAKEEDRRDFSAIREWAEQLPAAF